MRWPGTGRESVSHHHALSRFAHREGPQSRECASRACFALVRALATATAPATRTPSRVSTAGARWGTSGRAISSTTTACRSQLVRIRRRSTLSCPPAGFHEPHVNQTYQRISTVIGATMWFWVLYRAKEDGPALIVSWHSRATWTRDKLRCAWASALHEHVHAFHIPFPTPTQGLRKPWDHHH